jgi:hypothetical protein
MSDISVFRYFQELCMAAQWGDYGKIPCDVIKAGNGRSVTVCPFPDGEAVLDFYGIGRPEWVCWLVIAVWWVVFKVLGYKILLKKCRPPTSAFGGPPPDDATKETMPSGDGSNALLVETPTGEAGGAGWGGASPLAAGSPKARRTLVPVTLSWRGLGLTVQVPPTQGSGEGKPPSHAKTQPKAILKGLTGAAEPGELVALMGGSSSGKVTNYPLFSTTLFVFWKHSVDIQKIAPFFLC